MTSAELHKLLTQAVIGAQQELASGGYDSPHVRRAYELLTSVMNRVIYAAHHAYPDRVDFAAAMRVAHDVRGEFGACPCACHSDGHGRREWPLLSDAVGEITACARCRDDHPRLMPPQDSAA